MPMKRLSFLDVIEIRGYDKIQLGYRSSNQIVQIGVLENIKSHTLFWWNNINN